jgi:iron complex outermembrane receptor protein
MNKKTISALLATLPLSVVASPTFAQDASASASPSARESHADDIVVTAQKREQRLQDVPISMAVVTGEQLTSFHAKDMADIAASVPNLYVERLNAADVIYIRGFGSSPGNFAFDQSVSLYQDGIYAGRGKQFEAPFFDIERIEVLRGPQGALFGKNTPAGAISIVTANPTPSFEAGVTGVYNFDLDGGEVSAYASGPVAENFGVRLAVKGLGLSGYIPNRTTGKDDPRRTQGLARLTLRYDDGTFDATAKVEYGESHTKGAAIVLSSTTAPLVITKDRFADGRPFGFAEGNNVTSKNASLTANYQIGNHTLTSITGYSTYEADRSNSYARDVPAVYLNRIFEDFEQTSQEIRLASPEKGTLEYIVGAYFDWSDYVLDYPKYYRLPSGAEGSMTSKFDQSAQSTSLFAQATVNLMPTLRVIGSARYSRTKKQGHFETLLLEGDPIGAITSARGRIVENNVDPSLTVQFDAAPDVMLYASYGRGSKSGGFVSNTTGTVDSTFTYRPERSTNYEVGVKASLFDRLMTVDMALYDLSFDNLQTSVYDPTLTPRGIEWSVSLRPVQSLRLSWSGAYQDAKYDNFPGANCLANQPASVCSTTAPPGAPNNPANNNLAGYSLPFSSKWSGSVSAQYDTPVGDRFRFVTSAQLNYRSKFIISDNQDPVYGIQPSYQKVDLRFQFGDRDDRWNVALVGRNITNERTYTFGFAWPGSLSYTPSGHRYLEETRTVSVEGSVRF